jgi:2-polyprenyl-3-methyl-5-hydroxy-6-metoxy-1,4-benzoquinol methylase
MDVPVSHHSTVHAYQPDNPLQLANRARVPFFIKTLQEQLHSATLEGKRVLDVGCGGGIVTEAIAKHTQAQVVGTSPHFSS